MSTQQQRLARLLGYLDRPLYSSVCPDDDGPYHARLIQQSLAATVTSGSGSTSGGSGSGLPSTRPLYAAIRCDSGSGSGSTSGSSGSTSGGSTSGLYTDHRLARLIQQEVAGRPLYAAENPCCIEGSFGSASGSGSFGSASGSSGSGSSGSSGGSSGSSGSASASGSVSGSSGLSGSSGSGSLSGSVSGSVSGSSGSLGSGSLSGSTSVSGSLSGLMSGSSGVTISGSGSGLGDCLTLLGGVTSPSVLNIQLLNGTDDGTPSVNSCSCLEGSGTATQATSPPPTNILLAEWNGEISTACGAAAHVQIFCTDNANGTHTIQVNIGCGATNVGSSTIVVPTAELNTLDVTLSITMTDPVWSLGCNTCRFQWFEMPMSWVLMSNDCGDGYCACPAAEDLPPGTVDLEEQDFDCIQTSYPCCLGTIDIRVTA